MAVNYSQKLPQDRNNAVMTGLPVPFPAFTSSIVAVDNASTSSVTALGPNTTIIEVAAVGAGVGIKWSMQANLTATSSVITAAGTANIDNFIPSGTVRQFVVPRNSQGTGTASIGGIRGFNTDEGLYNGVAIKSAGIGSVLLTQY